MAGENSPVTVSDNSDIAGAEIAVGRVVTPNPGDEVEDVEVFETAGLLVNAEEWVAHNRWMIENDTTTTDDEATQSSNVPVSCRPEE